VEERAGSIERYLAELEDPRVERTRLHSLHDILLVALCAVIAGADSWVSVEMFGRAKQAVLAKFLRLDNGIPSHDTFGRVFARLDPQALSRCFSSWVADLAKRLGGVAGKVIAVDGKTLRRSFDRAASKTPIHLVSAFATEVRLVLGQVATEEKSNEITAIPKLLSLLDIAGGVVTIDAMGCQKAIVKTIVEREADYVIGLKGNQAAMHREVRELFEDAEKSAFQDLSHAIAESVDGEHGRIETRRCWCTSDIDWFADRALWAGLRSFAMVEAERIVGSSTTRERRFFISSLDGTDASAFLAAVRAHWSIENELHWVLDVAFREDQCRVRKDHGAENLATLRHMALNLLKRERTAKVGVANKRLRAAWDDDYLFQVLAAA
jgi:predicted transposase YbfD/YdcC